MILESGILTKTRFRNFYYNHYFSLTKSSCMKSFINKKVAAEHAKNGNLFTQIRKNIASKMPLFRKSYTYISQEVTFAGDMNATENIVIDGTMQGNIRSEKHVALGASARFEGSIKCEAASISGDVKGCIHAKKTIIVCVPATISGDLISASVQVESGVILRGRIISTPHDISEKPFSETMEEAYINPVEPIEEK